MSFLMITIVVCPRQVGSLGVRVVCSGGVKSAEGYYKSVTSVSSKEGTLGD